jgi:lipoate-protein ligase A
MRLYNLGKIPWDESQLIYHTLAALGREALALVSPATPYVCIGFHQDASQEVDLEYCREKGIPVFRREVGGGAVYLDYDQLFFQLVLRGDNPDVPKSRESFYRKFLQPVINAYRRIGIPAEYKPVNDVIAGTRKISGTGAAEIGDCVVFVGNMIRDFNYEMMARVLKVPDEKFRDKVHKTLLENLATIKQELGQKEWERWDDTSLNTLMAEEFQKVLGPMEPAEKDEVLEGKMDELRKQMLTEEWFFQRGRKQIAGRQIKIRSGTEMVHRVHKAPGGLMRADFEVSEGRFESVQLSGDFFCFPKEAIGMLESTLEGQPMAEVATLLEAFYNDKKVETPGIGISDWLKVLDLKSGS